MEGGIGCGVSVEGMGSGVEAAQKKEHEANVTLPRVQLFVACLPSKAATKWVAGVVEKQRSEQRHLCNSVHHNTNEGYPHIGLDKS